MPLTEALGETLQQEMLQDICQEALGARNASRSLWQAEMLQDEVPLALGARNASRCFVEAPGARNAPRLFWQRHLE